MQACMYVRVRMYVCRYVRMCVMYVYVCYSYVCMCVCMYNVSTQASRLCMGIRD